MPKYIFILGGGYSGLGKGVVTASIAKLLQNYGFSVKTIKIDPYFNLGAGDQNPNEHGEVFVTEDGGEIDQDFGHYERMTGVPCKKFQNITSGKIYSQVLENTKKGKYLGKTVQLIPHVRNEVKNSIKKAAKGSEIAIIEIGGTIGDDEALVFMRAINSMINEDNEECCIATLVPLVFNKSVGEPKTKIAQLAIRSLNELGLNTDFLIVRTDYESFLDEKRKQKLHTHCNVKKDHIIVDPSVDIVYRLPFVFYKQKFGEKILKRLGMNPKKFDWEGYEKFVEKYDIAMNDRIPIAYVGKYVREGRGIHKDAYISVEEALKRACIEFGFIPEITRIDSTNFDEKILSKYAGIIVPGGYGTRGLEGKVKAIKFARENKIPFLGLCLGLQMAVVEFARNVCELKDAKTDEMDEERPIEGINIVSILKDQEEIRNKSGYFGTQRLGDFATVIQSDFIKYLYKRVGRPDKYEIEKIKKYDKIRTGIINKNDFVVLERHRHRREVNPKFHDVLLKNGMEFSGIHRTLDGTILVEIIRLPHHPYFVASQFHPEFTSNYIRPNPLFYGFAEAVKKLS